MTQEQTQLNTDLASFFVSNACPTTMSDLLARIVIKLIKIKLSAYFKRGLLASRPLLRTFGLVITKAIITCNTEAQTKRIE